MKAKADVPRPAVPVLGPKSRPHRPSRAAMPTAAVAHLAFDGEQVWEADESGRLRRSNDAGQSWTRVPLPGKAPLSGGTLDLSIDVDGEVVAFFGKADDGTWGVYKYTNDQIHLVADSSTAVPSGLGTFDVKTALAGTQCHCAPLLSSQVLMVVIAASYSAWACRLER